MITMEDNKRKFKAGDIVELIKDKIEFKKGSLFVVISNITMRGRDAVTVKSKLDNQEYWIYDNELKLYKLGNEEFLDGYKPELHFSTVYNKYNLLGKVMENIEESNKNDSLSQVIDKIKKEYQEQNSKKLKQNNDTKSKFNIKSMNIIINRGIFKGQECEIISEEDKTYTIRLLDDDNFNIIKINKSDLYVKNEHEYEIGYYLDKYKYYINGSKTILMDKDNNTLASTICLETDEFDKIKALKICEYKHLIKKHQKMIKSYQKELNKLMNE